MNDLALLVAEINKKKGEGTITLGTDLIGKEIPRTTSGSLSIDVMLGGGWPLNQWTEIVGDESHGKTAVVFKTIAANQRLDPKYSVLWLASEEFVPSYAEMLGCDLNRFAIFESNMLEEAGNTAHKALENRAVDCIVIDSLPAFQSEREDEGGMEDLQVGQLPYLWGKFFRKADVRRAGDERPVLGLVVNQWREKIGVMRGDPRTTPGGKAKNFYYFVRVEVRRDEWIENTAKKRIGQVLKIRNLKNKTAPPGEVATVDFYFADGKGHTAGSYDEVKDVTSVAMALGVVARKGAWYHFEGEQWQGREPLFEAVDEDPELADRIRKATLDYISQVPVEVEESEEQPPPQKAKRTVAKRPVAKKSAGRKATG